MITMKKMTEMTAICNKNDKNEIHQKKSQKLISTKNNLLISRTAERHARGQKLHYEKLFSVLIKLNNIE